MPTAIIYATGGNRPGYIISTTTNSNPDDNALVECGDGEAILWEDVPPADLNAYYVLSGAVTARPAMPITRDKTLMTADGEDVVTFSNVPVGATASVRMWSGTVSDGELELTMTLAGEHEVAFSLWPYQDATFRVTAEVA